MLGVQGVPKTPKCIVICGNLDFGGLGVIAKFGTWFQRSNFFQLGIFKLLEKYPSFLETFAT
jgi:hypothetical protein